MDEWGPSVWSEFHHFAVSPPSDRQAIVTFYTSTIPSKIQCYACTEKYTRLLIKFPIPEDTVELFEWTVHIHNVVNLMLRKPLMSIDEARALYNVSI